MSPRSTCPAYPLENLVIMWASLGAYPTPALGPRSHATDRRPGEYTGGSYGPPAPRGPPRRLAPAPGVVCLAPLRVGYPHDLDPASARTRARRGGGTARRRASPPRAGRAPGGQRPVAVLPPVAPAALQGFSASLSHALGRTLPDLSPPLRGLMTQDVVNAVNAQGLAAEYSDLLAGFGRSGILERERLRRLGATLDCRYALLPGIAAFDHSLLDRFEMAGLKIVRTRSLVLRL